MVVPNYDTINGKLYYQILNSWGSDWGDNGTLWVEATHPMFRDFHFIAPRTSVLREDIIQLELPVGSTKVTKIVDFTNYTTLESKQPTQIIAGTTVVPVRAIFELLGLQVDYDTKNRVVKATNYKGWNPNE